MNAFQTPETTMTAQEAEAIVRRYLERTADAPVGPSVSDVAEALRVSPEEVARLLAEVRAAPQAKLRRQTTRRERRVWLLSGVAALLIVFGTVGVSEMRRTRSSEPAAYQVGPPTEPFQIELDGTEIGTVYYNDGNGPPSSELPALVQEWMQRNQAAYAVTQSYGAEAAERGIRAAKEGRWKDIRGVRMAEFDLRKSTDRGFMRWARATIPVYDGDDSLIADAVARERRRRVDAAVAQALEGVPELSRPVAFPR